MANALTPAGFTELGDPKAPITLVTWGGTITMCPDPDHPDTLMPGAADAVVTQVTEQLQASNRTRPVTHVRGPTADSADATTSSLTALVESVSPAVATGPVLITHGTDTLSFAAGLLAVSLAPRWPVILTGATTPLGTPGSDATLNLSAALAGLDTLPAGVWVVFATQDARRAIVLQGGYATKRTARQGGFGDIGDEPYGYLDDGKLLVQGALRPSPVLPMRSSGPVHVELVWPGWEPSLEPGCAPDRTVVYVLYACATAPSVVHKAIAAELAASTRVLVVTWSGTAAASYQSTVQLAALGAEPSTLPFELVLAALVRPAAPAYPAP